MTTDDARFVGSIPELYDRHLGPVLFEPYAESLASRLPATARRVLEVAAGTGRATRHLLDALRADGELVATDLNEPMLDVARTRIVDPRLHWQTADAQALPFEAGRFDAVVCQFGLMFMPDRVRALREMHRVLVPGGTLLLNTWDALEENPGHRIVHDVAMATLPDDPPVFLLTPFSITDVGQLRRFAVEGGFRDVRILTIAYTGHAESAHSFVTGLVAGNPMWNQLVQKGIDPASVVDRAAAQIARDFGDVPCRIPLSAHELDAIA